MFLGICFLLCLGEGEVLSVGTQNSNTWLITIDFSLFLTPIISLVPHYWPWLYLLDFYDCCCHAHCTRLSPLLSSQYGSLSSSLALSLAFPLFSFFPFLHPSPSPSHFSPPHLFLLYICVCVYCFLFLITAPFFMAYVLHARHFSHFSFSYLSGSVVLPFSISTLVIASIYKFARRRSLRIPRSWQIILIWGGLRGTIAFSLALRNTASATLQVYYIKDLIKWKIWEIRSWMTRGTKSLRWKWRERERMCLCVCVCVWRGGGGGFYDCCAPKRYYCCCCIVFVVHYKCQTGHSLSPSPPLFFSFSLSLSLSFTHTHTLSLSLSFTFFLSLFLSFSLSLSRTLAFPSLSLSFTHTCLSLPLSFTHSCFSLPLSLLSFLSFCFLCFFPLFPLS